MKVQISLGLLVLLSTLWGCGTPTGAIPASKSALISTLPTSAVVGSPNLTLTIRGQNFASGPVSCEACPYSIVVWSVQAGSSRLATSFVNSTQLTAIVPAALLTRAATAQVFVETWVGQEDVPRSATKAATFLVKSPPAGAAVIASISPLSMTAGSSDLTLTITGSNFAGPPCLKCDAYSLALWSANGTDVRLTTTFVDSGELTAIIPAALLTGPVTAEVFVQTWAGAQSDNDHVVAATSAFAFTVTP